MQREKRPMTTVSLFSAHVFRQSDGSLKNELASSTEWDAAGIVSHILYMAIWENL